MTSLCKSNRHISRNMILSDSQTNGTFGKLSIIAQLQKYYSICSPHDISIVNIISTFQSQLCARLNSSSLTLSLIKTLFDASAADGFLKTKCQKKELLKTSNFSFCHNVFHFQSQVIHTFLEIFHFLTKYVQSRLLQNCRMRKGLTLSFQLADVFDKLLFYLQIFSIVLLMYFQTFV